jgi:hypothetical protein
LACEGRDGDLDELGCRSRYVAEVVTALKIHIGEIALVDWECDTRFGSSFINHASRIFIRPAEKWTFENQLATFAALNAFTPAVFDHFFNIAGFDGAEKKTSDFIAQSSQVGCGGAAHQFPQPSVRHIHLQSEIYKFCHF